jgi:hypothetical protein
MPHFLQGTQNGHGKEMKNNEIYKGEIMERKSGDKRFC